MKIIAFLLVFLSVASAGITVINKVKTGASTLTIFDGIHKSGIDLLPGRSGNYPLPALGLGIQENGMYKRSSNPNHCKDPDNAGMQLTYPSRNCNQPKFDPAVFCPVKNTWEVVQVTSSGNWPNCQVIISRG